MKSRVNGSNEICSCKWECPDGMNRSFFQDVACVQSEGRWKTQFADVNIASICSIVGRSEKLDCQQLWMRFQVLSSILGLVNRFGRIPFVTSCMTWRPLLPWKGIVSKNVCCRRLIYQVNQGKLGTYCIIKTSKSINVGFLCFTFIRCRVISVVAAALGQNALSAPAIQFRRSKIWWNSCCGSRDMGFRLLREPKTSDLTVEFGIE